MGFVGFLCTRPGHTDRPTAEKDGGCVCLGARAIAGDVTYERRGLVFNVTMGGASWGHLGGRVGLGVVRGGGMCGLACIQITLPPSPPRSLQNHFFFVLDSGVKPLFILSFM